MCCWLQGSIAKHPFPGYFGNSAGTTAYFLAYGSGVLHALLALSSAHSPLSALLCLYSTKGCGLKTPAPLKCLLACAGRQTGPGCMHGPLREVSLHARRHLYDDVPQGAQRF